MADHAAAWEARADRLAARAARVAAQGGTFYAARCQAEADWARQQAADLRTLAGVPTYTVNAVRRAFMRQGKPQPTPAELAAWVASVSDADLLAVPLIGRRSVAHLRAWAAQYQAQRTMERPVARFWQSLLNTTPAWQEPT